MDMDIVTVGKPIQFHHATEYHILFQIFYTVNNGIFEIFVLSAMKIDKKQMNKKIHI